MAAKGSVAVKRTGEKPFGTQQTVNTWDEQYSIRPLWWKGPYNIDPVVQLVRRGAAILDIGCGTGRYLVPLHRHGFVVTGADLSKVALSLLGQQYTRAVADVRTLPFVDNAFDAVTCYGVLQHLTQAGRERAVKELFRVLRHNGLAFAEVTGRRDMRCDSDDALEAATFVRDGVLHHYFLPSELGTLFKAAGFRIASLDNQIGTKKYRGVNRTRQRITVIARKL